MGSKKRGGLPDDVFFFSQGVFFVLFFGISSFFTASQQASKPAIDEIQYCHMIMIMID